MPENPTIEPNPPQDLPATASGLTSFLHRVWAAAQVFNVRLRRLPRRIRLVGAAVAMLLLGLALFSSSFPKSAKLNISCQHSFASAEVSVSIDGTLIYRGDVSGTRKRFGLFGGSKARGLATRVEVAAGRHTVQVRLKADGYDQTKTTTILLSERQENSLSITQDRHGLSLMSQAGAEAPTESGSLSAYQKYLSSIVLSILGSGMSAMIGFLVQDFMRSQKGRFAAVTSQTEMKG